MWGLLWRAEDLVCCVDSRRKYCWSNSASSLDRLRSSRGSRERKSNDTANRGPRVFIRLGQMHGSLSKHWNVVRMCNWKTTFDRRGGKICSNWYAKLLGKISGKIPTIWPRLGRSPRLHPNYPRLDFLKWKRTLEKRKDGGADATESGWSWRVQISRKPPLH